MALAARTWIGINRLKRKRRRRPSQEEDTARRQAWLREIAPGKSFADIGGLFGMHGEIAFLAEEAGATAVTEFDGGDAELSPFTQLKAERGSNVRFVQGDLEDIEAVREIGPHDIVWYGGLFYHTPNPVLQLLHLRQITRELLYVRGHTVPEVPGLPGACVYYPYLPDGPREAIASAHFEPERCWGIGVPFDDTPMHGHANFWWAITPSALRAMLLTARFEVIEEFANHSSPFITEFVARPIDKAPILPPVDYYREWGKQRQRGDDPPPFATYYDSHPEAWQLTQSGE